MFMRFIAVQHAQLHTVAFSRDRVAL